MRARRSIPSRLVSSSLVALAPILAGCGSRGDPLPPVYPNPPPITGLIVAQRGSFGILRFPPPELSASVGAEDVELESVEVLVYAERYPVLNVDMLIAGLERRRDVMVEDARAQAAATLARAELEANTAAGIPPPASDDANAPATTVRRRTADEDAIHRVPEEVLLRWRQQGLAADAILQSARRLANAVQVLWNLLPLPATIFDPSQPPPTLPSSGEIGVASEPILRGAAYERPLQANAFLGRAAVSREVPVEQFDEILVDEMLQVAVPLGTPAPGELRTRYFFAVRSKSTRQTPGQVTAVVSMAPVPVPVASASLDVTIGASGVELTWEAPAGDMLLRRLDPSTLTYNVYRMLPDEIARSTPLNPTPLVASTYTDGTMQWGETYIYEVRASIRGSPPPPRESDGVKTDPIKVDDVYPPAPPTNVVPTRAGSRVTLQWTPSTSLDIVGYRVYRHPYPAPAVPLRFDPTLEEVLPSETPVPQGPVARETEGRNQMVEAGWELLTNDPVPFSRSTDGNADSAVQYVYAVEAVDAAGNLSALAVGSEAGDRDR
ncbi:MAG: hypothetical protein IH849_08795 [Acidobacteria bacterium]|nr:hypothetical protein [Acidobacteriota bacterium]